VPTQSRYREAELEVHVPVANSGPSVARREIDPLMAELPEVADDVRLLVSELVTNSIRHGGCDPDATVDVRLVSTGTSLRIEVCDPGNGFEPEVVPRPDEEGGWGLFLVDALTDRWGVHRGVQSCVWAEMDLGQRRTA
jgi:anti-sigma regulatory factor (Ser/Thr protein kinase)